MPAFKAISPDLNGLISFARPLFSAVYNAQMDRVMLGIDRADPDTIEAFFAERFNDEEALVNDAVAAHYQQMAEMVGIDALAAVGSDVTWQDINAQLLAVAESRAAWFSNAMTQTSIRQTQEVILKWRETGETINELKELVRPVWTGPRPDVAAVTEATHMTAQIRSTSWQQSGGVWGYEVRTANDALVRPSHEEVARGGPYPLTDTAHLPPINGDPNCRCYPVPVLENPNA